MSMPWNAIPDAGKLAPGIANIHAVGEGRKRVIGIIAGILGAGHLKTTEDLFDSKPSARTESLVASAVQWASASCGRLTHTAEPDPLSAKVNFRKSNWRQSQFSGVPDVSLQNQHERLC